MDQVSASDLAKVLADKHGLTQQVSKDVISTFLNTIVSEVKAGKKVSFPGFGSFEKVHRKERTGTNPSTGEKMVVAATDVPKFKVGTTFKKEIKGD